MVDTQFWTWLLKEGGTYVVVVVMLFGLSAGLYKIVMYVLSVWKEFEGRRTSAYEKTAECVGEIKAVAQATEKNTATLNNHVGEIHARLVSHGRAGRRLVQGVKEMIPNDKQSAHRHLDAAEEDFV